MGTIVDAALMALYSLALTLALLLSSPYWLLRMLTSGRYRAGLAGRLGRVPAALRSAVRGKQVVWLHAVSVGEVLAATQLVRELESRLNAPLNAMGKNWIIVVSTTTATGQALARERFAGTSAEASPQVFWYPFDFAFAVRACLRALRPRLLVLMESELWPRMLYECRRARIPVAVVNARVSDRSFRRALKLRRLWTPMLGRISLFLAQSEQDAARLRAMGAAPGSVRSTGNLKYDIRPPDQSPMAESIRRVAQGRPILVAGSTHPASSASQPGEEQFVIQAWEGRLRRELHALLVLAPRHPDRFAEAESVASGFRCVRASTLKAEAVAASTEPTDVILLDTVGDLASIYGIASAAFVGGTLVARGGHNPLEPAQFGVPVVIGPSWENFRDIVDRMRCADAIRIIATHDELEAAFFDLLTRPEQARTIGARAQSVCREQQGATARTVDALLTLLPPRGPQ